MRDGEICTENSIWANLLNNLNFCLNVKLTLPLTYFVARICQSAMGAKLCDQIVIMTLLWHANISTAYWSYCGLPYWMKFKYNSFEEINRLLVVDAAWKIFFWPLVGQGSLINDITGLLRTCISLHLNHCISVQKYLFTNISADWSIALKIMQCLCNSIEIRELSRGSRVFTGVLL